MNVYVKIIVNVLYYLFGKDTYKKLKSYNDLENVVIDLAATLKRLIEVQTDDESIIEGRNEYLPSYQWFKGHLFDVISLKYVILNENFKEVAERQKEFRLINLLLNESLINELIVTKFNMESVASGFKKDSNLSDGKVMTALQWNSFWSEILRDSVKDKTMENLSSQFLILNQVPGVVEEIVQINAAKEKISSHYLHNFRNETEYPLEFAIVKCSDTKELKNLSPSKVELTQSNMLEMYDVHAYLFSDI